jgi:hypothetical protein
MLEFLCLNYLFGKKHGEEHFVNSENVTLSAFLVVVIAVATAYLAYECNRKASASNRTFFTILAFLFSNIYLIYYLIRYVLMGHKCR